MIPNFMNQSKVSFASRLRYYFDVVFLNVRGDLGEVHYRNFLGKFWFLLVPIMSTFGYYILTSMVFGYSSGDSHIVFLLIGITFWTWFTQTLTSGTSLVLTKAGVITTIRFPLGIFVFAQSLKGLVLLGIQIIVVLFACLFFGNGLHWVIIYLPVIIIMQLAVNMCLVPYLAILGTIFRDVANIMSFVATLLMYVSPVIYEKDKIPKLLKPISFYNPFTYIMEAYRDILLRHTVPDFLPMFGFFIVCVVIFVCGMYLLKKAQPYLYRFI